MINVMFVSMCEKNAITTTREILDGFARRISTDTWFTRVTYKTLNDIIIKQLKKTATKNTAIGIYVVNNKHKAHRLYETIGKKLFNDTGNIPISYSKKIHYQLLKTESIQILQSLKQLTFFAGLFHDIGKNNGDFQKKLTKKNSNTRDLIRHEAVSAMMLDSLFNDELHTLNKINFVDKIDEIEKFIEQIYTKNRFSLYELLKFTILNHHKMLEIDYIDEEIIVNDIFLKEMCGEFKTKKPKLKIQKNFNTSFLGEFYTNYNDFRNLANIYISKKEFVYYFMMIREVLMLSDHFISYKNKDELSNNELLANPSQILENHLINVAKNTQNIFDLIFNDNFNEIKNDKNLFGNKKFEWQDKTFKKLKSLENKPFIIFNLANTGSGKTIANAKIMNAIDSHKYNVLYPLRSLTSQTGEVYKNQLNIDKQTSLAVVMGVQNDEDDTQITYTTNAIDYQFKRNDKYQTLFNSNIVISTIDYLMRATQTKKSKYLLPFARLLNSDMVIDEIDNLNIADIQAMLKLVYLAGLFHKKVIFSSATLTKELSEVLYNTYKKGFDIYKNIFSCEDINVVLIDDKVNAKEVQKEFIKEFDNFTNRKVKNNENKIIKNDFFEYSLENILKKIESLSENNCEIINNKKISIGLIKIYSINDLVKKAKEIIKYLDENSDKNFKYLIYHSHTFNNEKIEKYLYKLLTKKDDKYKDILNKEFDEDTTLLVFSTTIIDTGKDFDFDWGISEYVSFANIIQTAGRINRHRRVEVKTENFSVFKNDKTHFSFLESYEENCIDEFNITDVSSNYLFQNQTKFIENELKNIKIKMKESYRWIENDNFLLSSIFENKYQFRKSITKEIEFKIDFENRVIYKAKLNQNKKVFEKIRDSKFDEFESKNFIGFINENKEFEVSFGVYNNTNENIYANEWLGYYKNKLNKA